MLLSNYQQLLIVVCLAALSVGIALGTPVAACAHRVLLKRFTRASARERARLLLGLRWAPTVAGVVAASAVLLTFVRHAGVDLTSQASEGTIWPGILWRKGSFGIYSVEGSRFVEAMVSSIERCLTA